MRKIVKKFSFKIIKLLNMTDISFKNIIKAKKIIFMFHDVSDNPKEFYLDHNLNHSITNFENQLKFIKDNFHILSPSEIIDYNGSDPATCITFDDGSSSFYSNAKNILLEYNIPSINFLNYSQINGKFFIPGLISYILKYERDLINFLSIKDVQTFDYNKICKLKRNKLIDLKKNLIDYHGSFLNHKQILEMDNLKIFFWGNHLFKHLNSIHITGNQLENEYKKNNFFLKKLKNNTNFFSYPYGQKNTSYNSHTNKILRKYAKMIFTANPLDLNNNLNIYPRVGFNNQMFNINDMKNHFIAVKIKSLFANI